MWKGIADIAMKIVALLLVILGIYLFILDFHSAGAAVQKHGSPIQDRLIARASMFFIGICMYIFFLIKKQKG